MISLKELGGRASNAILWSIVYTAAGISKIFGRIDNRLAVRRARVDVDKTLKSIKPPMEMRIPESHPITGLTNSFTWGPGHGDVDEEIRRGLAMARGQR